MEQSRVTVHVHCTSSQCQKHAYKVWSHSKLWLQSYTRDKKCSIKINQRGIIKKGNKIE